MSKIVITGVSSFIGCHLARHFSDLNYEVIGTVSKPLHEYKGIQRERINMINGIQFHQLDLTNDLNIQNIIRETIPDYWIHHAGYAQNYGSYDYDSKIAFQINVLPLFTIFKELTKVNSKGIIVTGTNAEYSNCEFANAEDENCLPSTPYGVSKLTETLTAHSLSEYYGLPTRVGRVFIPFGNYDSPMKLFPFLISQLLQNSKVDLTPGLQKRDFIYVKEVNHIYQALIHNLNNGGFDIFNACSGSPVRLKDFIYLVCEKLNKDKHLLDFSAKQMREGETMVSFGSSIKLEQKLKYKFIFSLEDAIEDYLIEFNKNTPNGI